MSAPSAGGKPATPATPTPNGPPNGPPTVPATPSHVPPMAAGRPQGGLWCKGAWKAAVPTAAPASAPVTRAEFDALVARVAALETAAGPAAALKPGRLP